MNSKQAKEIKLEVYLERLGYTPTKRTKQTELWYNSPFRNEKTASFKVNTILNTWYDFTEGVGGTIIDLAVSLFQTNVKGALEKIESTFSGSYRPIVIHTKQQQVLSDENEPIITEIKALSYFPLINYLTERKINIDIAKKYLVEIYYTVGSKNYFALGFKNDSGGYETRNNIFKGSFSPKDITTFKGREENEKVSIFEGFIDFLSYLTYIKKEAIENDVIVLNSVSLTEKAIDKIKALDPSELYFYLDNDNAGEKSRKAIEEGTGIEGIAKNSHYAGYKDINDFLRGIIMVSSSEEKTKKYNNTFEDARLYNSNKDIEKKTCHCADCGKEITLNAENCFSFGVYICKSCRDLK